MKRHLMDILVCPICKGKLTLDIREENETEVVEGELHCSSCDQIYPIQDTIPNMLPPSLNN